MRLIDASHLIARKARDPRSQVLVRDNRRSVIDVLDKLGLNTDSAQRGQDVLGNARIFVLVVRLRAAGAHPPWNGPPSPTAPSAAETHLHTFGDRRDARSPAFLYLGVKHQPRRFPSARPKHLSEELLAGARIWLLQLYPSSMTTFGRARASGT